jgi:aminopeptidase-like protein
MNWRPGSDLVVVDDKGSGGAARARMELFISRYWRLNRVPVGRETTRMVEEMTAELGARHLSVPSGESCLTWVVPPAWDVECAYIETAEGERIADFDRNPLYVKSYSAAFSGEVARDELVRHIHSDPERSDCLTYDYRAQYTFGYREDWGFSLPHDVVNALADGPYRVVIDSSFSDGTLDVCDYVLPGDNHQTVFFAAHTCHPAQVNDGLACIAVVLELFRRLSSRRSRRYTYRGIFGPEYYAAAAILDRGENVEDLKCGFFLDMLGNGERIGFSRSYLGDTYIDKVVRAVLSETVDDYFEVEYRRLWGNDELFYDGPDFRIPTIGLGRDKFRYYHTSRDDPELCDYAQLEESVDLLERMVDIFERDRVIRRTYRGPLYLSRYDLYIDPKKDRAGYRSLQEIQILMDGTRSNLEIACELGISYAFVESFADALLANELAIVEDRLPALS